MKTVCVIFSLVAFNPDVYTVNEKPFASMNECLLWKHQREYQPPYEGHQSWYFCEEQ